MGTLYLIRHAQASYGQADYDRLSPRGIEQAQALAPAVAALAPDAVFIGPHVRQRQTAEHAGLAGTEHAGLAEYPAFALLQAFIPRLVEEDARFAALASAPTPKLMDEAFHRIIDAWGADAWTVAGVERVADFVARVRGALDAAMDVGGKVAVVTSAGPIGVALGLVFGLSPDRMIRSSVVVRNASITELRFRSSERAWDRVSLVTFNATGHLPAALVTER